jgi:hypothetical protein
MKIKGAGSESISRRHGSADPDPHQNVMDPQPKSGVRNVYPTPEQMSINARGENGLS